jgi:hypothetical protein
VKTEAEMRDEKAPTPETADELSAYVSSLVDREHDYGTCVYAMSLAATAAFNHVAHKLGVSGFQASCADLDIVRRTRHMEGPFMLIDGDNMLFPQYNLRKQLDEALSEWRGWAAKEAQKKLASTETAHPDVIRHWRSLADYVEE